MTLFFTPVDYDPCIVFNGDSRSMVDQLECDLLYVKTYASAKRKKITEWAETAFTQPLVHNPKSPRRYRPVVRGKCPGRLWRHHMQTVRGDLLKSRKDRDPFACGGGQPNTLAAADYEGWLVGKSIYPYYACNACYQRWNKDCKRVKNEIAPNSCP